MAANQRIDKDERGEQLPNGWWRDGLGQVGPYQPGLGPRSNPSGWFPTGPDVGQTLPPIAVLDQSGMVVDVETDRDGRPAVVVVFRSAVW